MLKVGITGGIGSGKTTVCRIFEVLGVPIYYADDRAKNLMVTNQKLIAQIKETFGEEAYTEGSLNREFLAQKVFNDKIALNHLNALVHPAVFTDVKDWMQQFEDRPYVLEEAALLFESGSYKFLDKLITVYAPIEVRIHRLKLRDKATYEQITARMKHQFSDEEKMKMADFVVYNDGSHKLIPQVLAIHHILLSGSKQP